MLPKIFVDWNNINLEGKVRFVDGTFADIKRLNIKLFPGLEVLLDDQEGMMVKGVVEFSIEENNWVARFDNEKLENESPSK